MYSVPLDEDVYEVFRCTTRRESVQVKVQSDYSNGTKTLSTLYLQPTVPVRNGRLKNKLSSVTVLPTPDLHTFFISNGMESVVGKSRETVHQI